VYYSVWYDKLFASKFIIRNSGFIKTQTINIQVNIEQFEQFILFKNQKAIDPSGNINI